MALAEGGEGRMQTAIAERFTAGESEPALAKDYDVTEEYATRAVRDYIAELQKEYAEANRMLRHLYGCPSEPFACGDPLHAAATEQVRWIDGETI